MRHNLASVFSLLLLLFLAPLQVSADGLGEEIRTSLETGRYEKLLGPLEEGARKDNAPYQVALGTLYLRGKGVKQDISKALFWYRKAAEQGYSVGQSFLGAMYGSGIGVPKDFEQAFLWYQKAAEQGFSEAQYNLGYMYYSGEVPKDYEQAIYWYQKAAEQGFFKAQLNLSAMYASGDGVLKDPEKTLELLQKAADQGSSPAQVQAAIRLVSGDGTKQNLPLALYYVHLASMAEDPRGPEIDVALKIAARLDALSNIYSKEFIVSQEYAKIARMHGEPKALKAFEELKSKLEKALPLDTVEKVNQAVKQWIDKRKRLDTPFTSQALKEDNPYSGEIYLTALPKEWAITEMKKNGATQTSVYFPKGQNFQNWTEKLTSANTFGLTYSKPEEHLVNILAELKENCERFASHAVFSGIERGYPAYVVSSFCSRNKKTDKGEINYFKVIQGKDSFYFAHRAWRGEAYTLDEMPESFKPIITEYATYLRDLMVCDNRDQAKACPTGINW